jgi:Tfp pilus assembly major pilin PilA
MMFCPKCGSPNDDNAFKCLQCGAVIQAVPPPVISVKQSNAPIVIIVVVVGLFFLIGVIGILAAIAVPQFLAYRVKSYDATASAALNNACATANAVLIKNPDQSLTLDGLIQEGLNVPPGVEIKIEAGNADTFAMTARHQQGRKTYFTDLDCNVQELNATK